MYKIPDLTTAYRKRLNYMLASMRVIIEHVFGLMKGRFRRILHFTEHHQVSFVANLVVCACILHNICIDQNDEFEEMAGDVENDEEEEDDDDPFLVPGPDRRDELLHELINRGLL